jgi:hypothetical protein
MEISGSVWYGVELDEDDIERIGARFGLDVDSEAPDLPPLNEFLEREGFCVIEFSIESVVTGNCWKRWMVVGAEAEQLIDDEVVCPTIQELSSKLLQQPSPESFRRSLSSWGLEVRDPRLLLGIDSRV